MKLLFVIAILVLLYRAFPSHAFLLMAYIGGVSIVEFLLFGWDKFCAVRNLRRIPEDVLLFIACIGGTFGAFAGQMFFRHKTIKPYFNRALIVIFALQALLVIGCSFLALKHS